MSIRIILLILLFHWFADFVMQDGEWAKEKSSNIWSLTKHVLMYCFIICIGIFIINVNFNYKYNFELLWSFFVITFLLHWITDFFTSKWTSYQYKQKNFGTSIPRGFDFFVTIGFDQWLHNAQLFITYKLLFL